MKRLTFTLLLTLFAALWFMAATPPGVVNYQGVLRDASGNALDGTYDMVFRFYDGPDSGLDTLLLTDTHAAAGSGAVTVSGGLFNVALGSGTLTSGSETDLYGVFRNNAAVWVEVQVGAETLAPLVQVRSAGFAVNADALDGMDAGDFAPASHDHGGDFLSAVSDDVAAGQIQFTSDPADTSLGEATALINPAIAGANEILLGVGVNGSPRLTVDAEGDLSVQGTTTLGNTTSDYITLTGQISSNIIPDIGTSRDLGSPTTPWRTLAIGSNVRFTNTFSNYIMTVENDTDTGIFYDATNNRWNWYGNGVQRAYLDFDNGLFTTSHLNSTGNTTLGNSNSDLIYLNGDINSNIIPDLNAIYSLGNVAQAWDEIYLSGGVRFSGPDQNLFSVENDTDSGVFWGSAANTWEYQWNGVSQGYFDLDDGLFRWGGDAYFDSGVTLGNDPADAIVFNGRVNSHLLPLPDAVADLGAVSTRWRNLYLSGDILSSGGTALYLKKDVVESTSGRFTFSGTPASTAVSGGSLYINPSSATANQALFGIALNGSQRFLVDEDGDVVVSANAAIGGQLDVEGQVIAGSSGTFSGNAAIHVDHSGSAIGGEAVNVSYTHTGSGGIGSSVHGSIYAAAANNTSIISGVLGEASGISSSTGSQYGVQGQATFTNSATHYGVFGAAENGSSNYGIVGQSSGIPLEARDGTGTAVLSTAATGLTTMTEMYVSGDAGIGVSPDTNWALNLDQSLTSAGSGGIKADGAFGPTRGYLAIQGNTDFDGITTLDISSQEIGVLGVSVGSSATDNYGVYAHSNYYGLRAEDADDLTTWANLAGAGWGINGAGSTGGGQLSHASSGNYAQLGTSTAKITGTGSVGFIQNHPLHQDQVIVYNAPEGAEVATYTRGSGRIEYGEARVELDPTFRWVTNPDLGLTVQLTPRGQWADLYVESVSTDMIVVKSRDGAANGVEFDYMVHGLRIGFEEVSVIRERAIESRIPSMATHNQRHNRNPGWYSYTAKSRFERNREALGRPSPEERGAPALLQAIGVHDPALHPMPTALRKRADQDAAEAALPVAISEPHPIPVQGSAVVPVGTPGPGHDKIRVDGEGNLYATSFRPDQSQIAQNQSVSGQVEAGDVLVVNRAAPDQLIPCAEEADAGVVGIAAASPGLSLKGQGKDRQAADQVPLALGGVVLCKVDAAYGPVQIGDLLVTSPTPGHAQRSDDPAAGTVVGKALEELEEGAGLIRVLVMLR